MQIFDTASSLAMMVDGHADVDGLAAGAQLSLQGFVIIATDKAGTGGKKLLHFERQVNRN